MKEIVWFKNSKCNYLKHTFAYEFRIKRSKWVNKVQVSTLLRPKTSTLLHPPLLIGIYVLHVSSASPLWKTIFLFLPNLG